MTEKACWKQFMITGRVEDYLQFKAIKEDTEGKKETKKESNCSVTKEIFHAGSGKCDRDRLK
ncbi:MAG: hypothetical protein IJP31_05115 [Lachnospiraceae bacterium]|nr:hypothetical protein [Lachnospiraceae bacterium]